MTLSTCSNCRNFSEEVCLLGQSYADIFTSVQQIADEPLRQAVMAQLAKCSFWEESELSQMFSCEVTLSYQAWNRLAYMRPQRNDQDMFQNLVNAAREVVLQQKHQLPRPHTADVHSPLPEVPEADPEQPDAENISPASATVIGDDLDVSLAANPGSQEFEAMVDDLADLPVDTNNPAATTLAPELSASDAAVTPSSSELETTMALLSTTDQAIATPSEFRVEEMAETQSSSAETAAVQSAPLGSEAEAEVVESAVASSALVESAESAIASSESVEAAIKVLWSMAMTPGKAELGLDDSAQTGRGSGRIMQDIRFI